MAHVETDAANGLADPSESLTGAGVLSAPPGNVDNEVENEETCHVLIPPNADMNGDEEEVCGVCLEPPAPGCFVELWCCGNILCVADAQQLGKCPFCREEPLVWNITK